MIHGKKQFKPDKTRPLHLGFFISQRGGAPKPRDIPDKELCFEVITRGCVYAPDGETICGPGWVFAHPPGTHTIFRSPEDAHYECLTATFHFQSQPDADDWPRSFQWRDADEAVRFCREMLFAYHHTSVDRHLLGNLIWAQLQFRLDQDQRQSQRDQITPRVSAVMSLIDKGFMHNLTIADLAESVEMSASHLQARFKQTVQMSPHQYLIQQRMRAARHRLVTTPDPIKQIAAEVGYANPENFCRAFKKHTGHTAAAFRRRYRVYGRG
ncbi:MAG: helix-turn-helix transcriptional regulator [Verrucomicrobia bacterium]|nr:helix-turn-helix transcriptional regulator [Verrucomicrobiota bacterium]MCH8510285.1 helix-turn-helix transcriptional regulator [Kiritimatiellia bacterium]